MCDRIPGWGWSNLLWFQPFRARFLGHDALRRHTPPITASRIAGMPSPRFFFVPPSTSARGLDRVSEMLAGVKNGDRSCRLRPI